MGVNDKAESFPNLSEIDACAAASTACHSPMLEAFGILPLVVLKSSIFLKNRSLDHPERHESDNPDRS
jgi:hypothetical protein